MNTNRVESGLSLGSTVGVASGPIVPLRRARGAGLHAPGSASLLDATISRPPLGVIAMSRMGFGPRPGDLEWFQLFGATDEDRLRAYVEVQLYPEKIDDSVLAKRLKEARLVTIDKSWDQLWTDHMKPTGGDDFWSNRYRPYMETVEATFLRATYSERQLFEVLVDFWHNHFNIHGEDYWLQPVWPHQDREIIRANVFGNFRKFLEDVATSYPMLFFLDNYINRVDGPNENFARELFELHGLGAENYLGVRRQDEVPVDSNGAPTGYVDDDVYEATRAFTGWGFDWETGRFAYTAASHDRFQKFVMGKHLRSDQSPMKDGRDVLDMIAKHPGTARFIARKLCRRLVSDDPPTRLVDEAAAMFLSQKDAPDQLRRVVRVILLSPEFRTTWGEKIKRPFEQLVGWLRALDVSVPFDFEYNVRPPGYFLGQMFRSMGQQLFAWTGPDGYPDRREKWVGTNPMVAAFRLINWLIEVRNPDGSRFLAMEPTAVLPEGVRSPVEIVDFWTLRLLSRPVSPAARKELIDFMARGRDPEMKFPDFTDEVVKERIWGTIGLILAMPENFLR